MRIKKPGFTPVGTSSTKIPVKRIIQEKELVRTLMTGQQ
jgi:hypothetical protein